jgi:hypothetical protein
MENLVDMLFGLVLAPLIGEVSFEALDDLLCSVLVGEFHWGFKINFGICFLKAGVFGFLFEK